MWGDPGPDPGGTKGGDTSTGPPSNQELIDLKDQFEQQQVLIAQLKEMLRKTEQTTVTEEKVEEYANTLTRMNARAKKGKLRREGDSSKAEIITTTVDTPAKEKIMLLRQQMEENKLKLAERGKFQKGIEETVTQLKAQLDDSQQLINQTPLNLSLTDPKTENYSINSNPEELFNLVLNKDRKISELVSKIQKLEANVIDLQENVKEKDSVIDARTKAITLMTESLSKKGKHTLDTLDDTKEQMRKMQENFINLEMQMKNEKQQLIDELEQKNVEIKRVQEINANLEKTCNKQQEEIEQYKNETSNSREESLLKQIEELNSRIIELESDQSSSKPTEMPRDSPQRSSKKGKKGQKMQKSKSKENKNDSEEITIAELQKQIEDIKTESEKHLNKIFEYELTINELTQTIEALKVTKEPVQSETPTETTEVVKLKKQLDDSNKNMIKIKAQHKSKVKELNKLIDELKKGSGSGNSELVKLQTENSKLNERIEFLEKQKESQSDNKSDSKERMLEVQLIEQSEILESKTQSIATLEEQIDSYKIEIKTLNERFQKLSNLENDQVVSEITSIHFEEQLDKLEMEKKELIQEKEKVLQEKEELLERIEALTKDKQEINAKLESYVQENMELIDKLEKLSAEKVSSAESIEIVEGLTHQEKLELEAYQKSLEIVSENIKNSDENLEQNPELNESVNQLTEETSDLLRKIELFTEERREVMEKMEALTSENNLLNLKIREIENNRDVLAETYEQLQNEKEILDAQLEQTQKNVSNLEMAITELESANKQLKERLGEEKEIKHGSEVEETVKLETVVPLTAAAAGTALDLQNQIDEYKALVEIQKQEIQELKLQLLSQRDLSETNRDLYEKMTSLETQYTTLLSENEQLKSTIKKNSELLHEKDTIETELIAAKKRLNEFDEKLTNNLEEIENYKSILEENKSELISSANLINDLQNKLQEKQGEVVHYENEILHLNSVITELNSAVSHLETENQQNTNNNETMELMSDQLQELKAILNENIKQLEKYEGEVQENSNIITSLNTQLKELNSKLLDMEHELECKDDELKKLIKDRDNKETVIKDLQNELEQKDQNFHKVCDTLKEKCLSLQNQIEQNAGSIDNIKDPLSKVVELETKNKEQLEKMKKIAASLKKKTAAYQELEEKYKTESKKLETDKNEKLQLQEVVQMQENKIHSLLEQLQESENKFAAVQNDLTVTAKKVDNLNNELEKLRQENEELQNVKQNCEMIVDRLTAQVSTESNTLNVEINEKNETIKNLQQQLETIQYQSETNSNALHAKIQEMEMFTESQEIELTKYKDKVNRLEEGLRTVEERRQSLEQKTIELDSQLQEKSNSYEEISHTEDILEQRLAALMVHDDKIEKRLREVTLENQELMDHNRILSDENDQLKHKLSAAVERNLDVSTNLERLNHLESENEQLYKAIGNLEGENKRLHAEYEKKVHEQKLEVETMEVELQGQLTQLDDERKALLIQCEQLRDQLQEQTETQTLLKEDLEQHKQKLEQQQNEFDASMLKYETVSTENKNNLALIEQLKLQLSIPKPTDQDSINQVVNELQRVVAEKDAQIEHYQKQNLQLQMQGAPTQHEAFSVAIQNEPQLTNAPNELQIIKDDLDTAKNRLAEFERANFQLQTRNSQLMLKIEELEKQHNTGNEKQEVSTAEQSFATFTWPEQSGNDLFEFVAPSATQPTPQRTFEPPAEISARDDKTEELLKKIKTLEFMLFNAEKEKDDALLQCQELTNEVARLIYGHQLESQEKVTETRSSNASNLPRQPQVDVEPQIISAQDAIITRQDLKQLHELEFSETKPCNPLEDFNTSQPVTEDIIQPKTAYLCYPSNDPPKDPTTSAHHIQVDQIEGQVMTSQEAEMTKADLKQLQKVEFEKTKDVTKSQVTSEDVMESKPTYLCYKPESSALHLDVFDENDDGWGCGPEEVKLEEDYHQRTYNPVLTPVRLNHVEELEERIRVLEVERERHLEEIKQAQIKSGKLIKKLKEFKMSNEKLTADLRRSSDFGGLDDAIQDELKAQITQLEKKNKEINTELDKEKSEKSNLLKKVDVLQTANERMVEMKEKQDVEMLMWQRQTRELSAKLEQFEWGDDGFESPKHTRSEQSDTNTNAQGFEKTIQELNKTIKELTLDNEELQTMLEEQRNLRIAAEKAKSVEPITENMKTEAEYLTIVAERNHLNEQLASSNEEKKALQEKLNNLIKSNGELQQKIQDLIKEQSLLETCIAENNSNLQKLSGDLQNLHSLHETHSAELQEAKTVIATLKEENTRLTSRLKDLVVTTEKQQIDNSEVRELQEKFSQFNQERIKLSEIVQEKDMQIESLNQIIIEHQSKSADIEQKLGESQKITDEKLKAKENELSELSTKFEEERANLSITLQQLADEWSQRVDQRGSDVAESWKLHLESRETEFMQVEQQLRKEINELEEKCNALVNENNELRKNVDAEIRNEVDKISALQQQINDGQHYINDLTKLMQEKQTEFEEKHQRFIELESNTLLLKEHIKEKDDKINEIEKKIAVLEIEQEEKDKIIEELQQKLKELVELQEQLNNDQLMVVNLQQENNEKQRLIDDYLKQLQHYKETCTNLEQQMAEKDHNISEMVQKESENKKLHEENALQVVAHLESQVANLNADLHNKDAEINKFNSLLKDTENLNSQLQEKQTQIEYLHLQLQNYQQYTQDMEQKDIEINQLKIQINNLQSLMAEKEREYAYNLQTTTQDSESVFHEKAQELDAIKRRHVELQTHYDEILTAKDTDMESLRLQLQEQINRNETIMHDCHIQDSTVNDFKVQLDIKTQECEELQSKVYDQEALHHEENKQLNELRQIIEDQVLKIEGLKQELFDKSKDYDSLIAELDIRKPSRSEPGTPPIDETFSSHQVSKSEATPVKPDNLNDTLEPVSQAELDLALYMLHQRDVRCEELTVELMQLLEERDTLQLKLSNAIREKEELRSRFLPSSVTPESTVDGDTSNAARSSSPINTTPKSRASTILLGATGTELATEATEHLHGDSLANKLSELKTIGYKKDKTLLDEQEQRRLQQLSLMQQHRDVAAMLPPEAAARLVQEASYTLSRDVQSPSKVLLNWLWGKSTPKVNNI